MHIRKQISRCLLFAAAIFVTGCPTTPVRFSAAKPVDGDNILSGYHDIAKPRSGTARVIFVRDSGLSGCALPILLSIDAKPVAKLWQSQKIEVFLTPGLHIFQIEQSPRGLGQMLEREALILDSVKNSFRISMLDINRSTHVE